ncbi:hypothetical protein [Falsiroseomonas sp. CW058]|uniref:hypothetical protein n=1 Tax=Falsiroseomonas sp. CW058 TaxID=3388664 RepID=UPI003D315956
MQISRPALALLLLLLPGVTLAQLRSGPDAPSVGGQLPPQQLSRDPAGIAQPTTQPPAETGTPRNQPARTEPPPGHQTLGAPAVPGARQPERSEGFADTGSPVPARPGARPDASTTGRDAAGQNGQGGGR